MSFIWSLKPGMKLAFKRSPEALLRSPEEIKLLSPLNNAVHNEHVTLIELYHHIVPNNNLDEDQILHWATEVNEMSGSLITNEDITENIISNK